MIQRYEETIQEDEELMDNDIVEIITHTYYADGKVVRTETDYKYDNGYQYYKHKDGTISTCSEIEI